MLVRCWSNVVDGGPEFNRDGIKTLFVLYVSMYMGVQIHITMMIMAIVQQTRHIGLVLYWCRASVVGGGPVLSEHWASFFLFAM